ncbi:hypothetical protein BG006_004935 [Podila minutissima]|uniref:Uncharacterized protein n=1 Tax=Podila minutissima TaxID=64525 RepID=A0A9P5SNM8_9FUNG|nr:hypothetical protein BG006_004935 [Podila minutissima]
MLPATISAPPSSGSSLPRQQRLNRKSGIAIAFQAQGSPSQTSTIAIANTNTKPRNLTQTHARHQSMPAQRPSLGSPNFAQNTLINSPGHKNSERKKCSGKRSPASMVTLNPQVQILQNSNHDQPLSPKTGINNKNKQRNHFPNQKQKNNQGNNGNNQGSNNNNSPSSKAKRVQRRKEIAATAESLAKVDLEVAMNQSPPLNPSSPPSSSTDSDNDFESAAVQLSKVGHPHHLRGYPNNPQFHASKQCDLSSSPPQRPNSAPVLPQPRKGMNTQARQPNQGRNINNQQGGAGMTRKLSFGSGLLLDTVRLNVVKASSADKIMLADRVAEKSRLYAGPTFHNSPAPNSLPIPAFSRSLGGSPVEPAVEMIPSPFFAEAASPQLNSMRQRTQSETTSWTNHHSMPGIPFQTNGLSYHLPDRMVTSSYSIPEHHLHRSDQLTAISQNLRSLLKIQSQ